MKRPLTILLVLFLLVAGAAAQEAAQKPERGQEEKKAVPARRSAVPVVCVAPMRNETMYMVNMQTAHMRLMENLKQSRRVEAVALQSGPGRGRQREAERNACEYLLEARFAQARLGAGLPPSAGGAPPVVLGPPASREGYRAFTEFTLSVVGEPQREVRGRIPADHGGDEDQLAFSTMDRLSSRVLHELRDRLDRLER